MTLLLVPAMDTKRHLSLSRASTGYSCDELDTYPSEPGELTTSAPPKIRILGGVLVDKVWHCKDVLPVLALNTTPDVGAADQSHDTLGASAQSHDGRRLTSKSWLQRKRHVESPERG